MLAVGDVGGDDFGDGASPLMDHPVLMGVDHPFAAECGIGHQLGEDTLGGGLVVGASGSFASLAVVVVPAGNPGAAAFVEGAGALASGSSVHA
ncbi:hypothetical protein [Mucisphaera sp.]|uniref:hypothetical protein n=1 Tax=Mucisphaera sp. TaxID=2913024 RepID=UPI003D14D848